MDYVYGMKKYPIRSHPKCMTCKYAAGNGKREKLETFLYCNYLTINNKSRTTTLKERGLEIGHWKEDGCELYEKREGKK